MSATGEGIPAMARLRDDAVFRYMCALIAVHVVTVEVVDLRPGADRGDHVVAALFSLAVVGIAAAAYPALRPGLRAALAAALGLLAAIAPALAVGELGAGASARGFTGLLMAPVALALLALAATLAYRSRRPSRLLVQRLLLALVVLATAFTVVLPIGFALVATHRPPPAKPTELGEPFETVTFPGPGGTVLAASYAPSRNGAAVITFPDRSWTADHARMLAAEGFGVLAMDMRGYGASEGDPNAFGWERWRDIAAGIDFLTGRAEVSAGTGGLGLSVGGEQMIEAAAHDRRLGAVIAEGAGERSVREPLIRGPAAALVIPQQAILTASLAALSGDPPPSALDELAARISPRALFLIEAEHGQGGEDLNGEYFAAAGEPKQYWLVRGAAHTGGIDAAPEEYRARISAFFREALGARSGG